jgi:hypothetical protein
MNGYHAALAMSLAHLSRGFEGAPRMLPELVALLDARLLKMQTLVAEVATRFPMGLQ